MKYSYPSFSDYDTEEEYLEACDRYEAAESAYVDECVERYYERVYERV